MIATRLIAAAPAALALALAACTVEPDVDTVPADTRTDAPADGHLEAITDTEARVDPQVDDYHRVHPESKEDPEEESPPQIPPPDHPLPRLEGDPTPVPATGSEEGPYREEPTTTRQAVPLDSDPPVDD
ncbi:MAG: hypothetical protein GX538_08010 [Gammaproteobacteria bacterium]|nr:hypothetical protein [Gammaproteobacteria bacterium]